MKYRCAFLFLIPIAALPFSRATSAAKGAHDIPVAVIEDKVRGGLLGEMVGDLNGLKHEMRYIPEPGNVQTYVPELPQGAWTDDDTDIEWVYVLEIQRGKEMMIPPQRIGTVTFCAAECRTGLRPRAGIGPDLATIGDLQLSRIDVNYIT